MPEPIAPKAALRREPPIEVAMHLTFSVQDPDVIAEVQRRAEGPQREEYLRTALRIGVLALRQAGGTIDAETVRKEGELLVKEVEKRLSTHAQSLGNKIETELSMYLDPESGHFQQRVRELVAADGKLAGLLRSHVEGDTSTLAKQLAAAVGQSSPLMKHLDPDNKQGLVETITRIAEARLEAQSKKVLGEFDLNNEQGALKRLISQIETNFNPENPKAALGVLKAALTKTQEQIRTDLSMDVPSSALSNLHAQLKKQIDQLAQNQSKFQTEVATVLAEVRGAKAERAVSPSGGFDFEQAVGDVLRERVTALGDLFESVGEQTGNVPRSKVGDHVQTLGAESAAAGVKVVYECKRADNYSLGKALAELDEARRNRAAEVGVFVLAASSVRGSARMQSEFSHVISRHGNDIVAVWDESDPGQAVVVDAVVTLARALAVRDASNGSSESETDWDALDKALNDVQRQIDYFEEMSGWCSNIKRDAKKIEDRLGLVEEALKRDLSRLNHELEALRP